MTFAHIFCSHLQQSVCINLESHINTFFACASWSDALYVKFRNFMIISCQYRLSLEYLNIKTFLVIRHSIVALCILYRNQCVSFYDSAHSLWWTNSIYIFFLCYIRTKRKWNDIEQKNVLNELGCLTRNHSSFDCSTVCNRLIWVHLLIQIFSLEEPLDNLLDSWSPSLATDEDHLVNLKF